MEMEEIFLGRLYKLGGFRLVRSGISEAALCFAMPPSTPTSGKEHSLRLGKLFCEAFLLGSQACNDDPKKLKIEMDSDLIRMYATLMKVFNKEDFNKYESDVKNIKHMLERLEKNEILSSEEKGKAIQKLSELYDLFEKRISVEEIELMARL
jgi:flagellin-specific chaperone FliS